MKDIHLLIGFVLIIFGLIGIVRPTPLHQKVTINKFSLGKRWWNLVPLIIGIILSFSILIDILFAFGCIAFLFGLIGMIRPTLVHEAVKFGRVHFASRVWNFGLFTLALLIIAIFAVPSDYVNHLAIRSNNQKLTIQLSELEEKVKELTQECRECEKTGKKQLAELDRLQKELTAAIELAKTSDPSTANNSYSLQQPSSGSTYNVSDPNLPPYRGTNVTCADFSTSAEATAYMNAYGVYKLDRDKDGIACEALESGETDDSDWEWETPEYFEPGSPEADPPPEGAPDDPEYEYEYEEEQDFLDYSEVPSSSKPPEYRTW